jgi:hypothetical protein
MCNMTDQQTIVGALIAALGAITGSWLVLRVETRKRFDDLFVAALASLDGGSQRRNVGLAQLRLYMRVVRSYDKDVCAEVLIGTATYLLLESEQRDRAHELLNLDRIMKMLLKDLRPSDGTRESYESLRDALAVRVADAKLKEADAKPKGGLWVNANKLQDWRSGVDGLIALR